MNGHSYGSMKTMLLDIENEVKFTRSLIHREALSEAVMDAMSEVPRELFVPEDEKHRAYANAPLPIGFGQTISQPYIVALMTDLLEVKPEDRILEIGTGSGYQTAILSLLCKQVYSLEVVPELSEAASRRLEDLGYDNIETQHGNGYEGWPEHAPYDGIIVTAAAPYIPEALTEQLKPGGKLVIPIGMPYMSQELLLVSRNEVGELNTESVLGVAFVPLVDPKLGQQT